MGYKFNPLDGKFNIVGGSSSPPPVSDYEVFEDVFNNTSDWSGPASGYYSITVLRSVHGKTTHPAVYIYEQDGSDFVNVEVDQVKINSNGDVSIRVPDTPDSRFNGKLIII